MTATLGRPRLYDLVCSVDECSVASRRRGMCPTHYSRWSKHGDPSVVLPRGRASIHGPTCTIEGCAGKHLAKGLCSTHYNHQWSRPFSPCSVEGCERPYLATGMCSLHYNRMINERYPERARAREIRRKEVRESRVVEWLEKQGGVCPLCGAPGDTSFVLDHDHACCEGKRPCGDCFRGALCDPCNRGLGFFGDSPDRLRLAASYLEGGDV